MSMIMPDGLPNARLGVLEFDRVEFPHPEDKLDVHVQAFKVLSGAVAIAVTPREVDEGKGVAKGTVSAKLLPYQYGADPTWKDAYVSGLFQFKVGDVHPSAHEHANEGGTPTTVSPIGSLDTDNSNAGTKMAAPKPCNVCGGSGCCKYCGRTGWKHTYNKHTNREDRNKCSSRNYGRCKYCTSTGNRPW